SVRSAATTPRRTARRRDGMVARAHDRRVGGARTVVSGDQRPRAGSHAPDRARAAVAGGGARGGSRLLRARGGRAALGRAFHAARDVAPWPLDLASAGEPMI